MSQHLSSILECVCLTVCGQGSFLWLFTPFPCWFLALKAIRDCGSVKNNGLLVIPDYVLHSKPNYDNLAILPNLKLIYHTMRLQTICMVFIDYNITHY
jgi:hypothetical protein